MQTYIREHEGETLIKLYPDLQGMAKSIRAQMKSIMNSGDIDDTIYSMALSHPTTDDVPSFSLGSVNDKTGRIALEFETRLSHELQSSLRELRSELLLVEVVLDKLDISLSALTKDQRKIIELKYWEGCVWTEVADKFMVSESNVKEQRKRGIERICKISRIDLDTYELIMKLFA
jgi:RNA polymerase sigma factor (sigma-70 family)